MQVAHQIGHSKIETTKNIYGHLFAQDRASILDAMNQAVTRLHVYDSAADPEDTAALRAESLRTAGQPGRGRGGGPV
jgi:hypothetical protein